MSKAFGTPSASLIEASFARSCALMPMLIDRASLPTMGFHGHWSQFGNHSGAMGIACGAGRGGGISGSVVPPSVSSVTAGPGPVP
jgi:hypothetical protein